MEPGLDRRHRPPEAPGERFAARTAVIGQQHDRAFLLVQGLKAVDERRKPLRPLPCGERVDVVRGRLEALRRQRYNRWATDQIEKGLDFYNANVSHFNPFNDNAVLIDSLVKNLGAAHRVNLGRMRRIWWARYTMHTEECT